MSTNVGAIHYDIGLDTSKFDSAAKGVSSSLGKMASTVGTFALKTVAAFGAAASAATGFAVVSAASFEQTRIGIENMVGSADKARQVLSEVSDFAAQTPFEFPELAGSVKQLIAFGFSSKQAVKTMKSLGDVSAAVGAPIGDLSYLMGTLKTQGKAMTIDIRQFAQRGIPIYEYLAKVLETDTAGVAELVTAGKVGFPEVEKAFSMMTGEGGQFYKTMEKQAKSLSGQWSTFKDNIGFAAREIVGINKMGDVRKGSIFDYLRIGVSELNKVLGQIDWVATVDNANKVLSDMFDAFMRVAKSVSNYLSPKFKTLWESIQNSLMPILKDLWHNVIEPLIPVLGSTLVAAIGGVVDVASILLDAFKTFYDWSIANKDWLVPIILSLGALKAAWEIWGVIDTLKVAMVTFQTVTLPSVTLSIKAFSAFLATPLIMPAIAVGAAIAAIVSVYNAYKKMKSALEDAKDAAGKLAATNASMLPGMIQIAENGRVMGKTNAQINAAKQWLHEQKYPGYAIGTDYAPGGMALVGERGPELVNLPRGSQVIPNNKINSGNGTPSKIVIENLNMSGIMARSRSDLRDIARDLITSLNEELAANNKGIISI